MSDRRVLIVEDEAAVCWSLERALNRAGYQVDTAASAEDAFVKAQRQRPAVILLDVRLPGMDGLSAMPRFRELTQGSPIIIITAHGTLSTAVKAVEGGAFDYLAKPFDLNAALDIVQRALATVPKPEADLDPDSDSGLREEIIGKSLAMQQVFKRIALVAPTDACVMITGESGTGKELVARAVHRHSLRRDRPFLPVHIAALNPNLIESELFGHSKGAFTGAGSARPGLLALADGGTVFLDELADIPLPVQAKLLRVLERQEVLPVGGTEPVPIRIRLLSATHQNLADAVKRGDFRHDLYYRLNVFGIHLPPLRDRADDIEMLAEYFLRKFDGRLLPVPSDTMRFLQQRPWRGNVREFRNALEHAAILARGSQLLPEHLPPPLGEESDSPLMDNSPTGWIAAWLDREVAQFEGAEPKELYDRLMQQVEPVLLEQVLGRLQGNRMVAARWLGLARATLRKLMRKYHLMDDDAEDFDASASASE
ncbi:sigma-54-dependent transcriptional regulator [Tuwongella immobilis]|uniref:DNA-binding transcriptional regulator NtrC n=1 Tax=Tuwongella immobilis TaxID=692036 RepID=A0A6C2YNE6_9BACT|nr:sigma-54 dependent transcriptional regulator [Tuwongella immobilis]VIP02897.1 two sigma54 transcriptional fis family : Two component, sigma54 specific, transcriptional regulator, Fis family OS=Pirellula staleyi (strain ATCC 27377 / DSM 6068 / ICPB 4128) GN=Psta_2438 PE=4 SV=1: Response_reg: Sigma54_activat: HTH_8 [Tuwongella immobilis]VTS02779.1 two sigma54 transcriptional fis family : Two component, sigma54 specific, transcriptional regulator, Fis family OS=Pirellula staleyi (strain ATCC 2737